MALLILVGLAVQGLLGDSRRDIGIGGYRHCVWGGDEEETVHQVVGGGIGH